MSTQRVNAAEKDLEKFIKFLALKSTQVVVQSRLGEKTQTPCNPLATGNDWFNLDIPDHPDVYAETKRALALEPGQSILQRLPLCIEISLKTSDGDQMVLEVWSIDVQNAAGAGGGEKQQKGLDMKLMTMDAITAKVAADMKINNGATTATNSPSSEQQTLKAAHAIYNRMGILLKSLISLTRATPAYKLSRRQCPDSFGIYYRIYVDHPQVHTLGEGCKKERIGQINTIVGVLTMSLAYRTKMTITPTTTTGTTTATTKAATASNGHSSGGDGSIMLKSDHFRPSDDMSYSQSSSFTSSTTKTTAKMAGMTTAASGMGKKCGPGSNADRKVINIEKPLRPGAFTDLGKLRQYTEEDYVLPETPPFEWLLRRAAGGDSNGGSIESLNRKCTGGENGVASPQPPPLGNGYQHNININHNNNNNANMINNNHHNNNNMAAFKNYENDENSQKSTKAASPIPSLYHRPSASPTPLKSLFMPTPSSAYQSSSTSSSKVAAFSNISTSDDDNLLKELNFPFASPTSHVNDLAKFYRDCYHAPPLSGLGEIQPDSTTEAATAATVATKIPAATTVGGSCGAAAYVSTPGSADSSVVDDLSRQLEQFETSLEDYDKLVSQLGLTTSSSTGSRSSGGGGLQMSN